MRSAHKIRRVTENFQDFEGSISCGVVISAGGSSARMGTGRKKEFEFIDGKPVLLLAVEPFLDCNAVITIVVVHPPALEKQSRELLSPLFDQAVVQDPRNAAVSIPSMHLVQGGTTRQQSVRNGLICMKPTAPDYVLIHDGSRPWVTPSLIMKVLECVIEHGACVPVVRPVDALKQTDENGIIIEHVEKNRCYGAQTPQGFVFSTIFKAHEHAAGDGKLYIDDAEVYAAHAGAVHVVEGEPANRKITFSHDIGIPGAGH